MTRLTHKIICGDCIEIMREIETKSIDMILCDLPYGTTACSWDTIIPFKPLWKQYKRIIKDNGAIVLTASQPFTSALVMSNIEMFKYELIWEKSAPTNFMLANKQPMKYHENILIFCKKMGIFNKQKIERSEAGKKRNKYKPSKRTESEHYYLENNKNNYEVNFKNPSSILKINNVYQNTKLHPTQKPVTLFEYLIKTYTNEGDLVLDNCIGSGTTLVSAERLKRNSIGIDLLGKWCEISYKRLLNEVRQGRFDKEPSIIERIGF